MNQLWWVEYESWQYDDWYTTYAGPYPTEELANIRAAELKAQHFCFVDVYSTID